MENGYIPRWPKSFGPLVRQDGTLWRLWLWLGSTQTPGLPGRGVRDCPALGKNPAGWSFGTDKGTRSGLVNWQYALSPGVSLPLASKKGLPGLGFAPSD